MSARSYSIRIRAGARDVVSCEGFTVPQGEVTFLFGESGIGKSLLCKSIYGLLDPAELDISVNGRPYAEHLADPEVEEVRRNSFFVFQEPSSHLNPLMRISGQLCEGSLGGPEGEQQDILRRLWEGAGDEAIRTIIDLYPKPFRPSGGEKQRILLAMAFKKIGLYIRSVGRERPSLFVFDEPTGSLDNTYRDLFLGLLFEKYAECPFTVMFITHDYSIISRIYAEHRRFLPAVHFTELSRVNDTAVGMHDFSAERYLSWLHGAHPSGALTGPERGEVLRVGREFTIFDRRYRICKDPERTQAAPLVIRSGEMVYLKAGSGVGKTTLAKIVMGLYRPQRFAMTLSGEALTQDTPAKVWERGIWGKKASMVFQLADDALDLEVNITETFKGLPRAQKSTAHDIVSALSQLFDKEGLTGAFLRRKAAFLSGGQKQRLNLLRSLVLNTGLVILDEPLNGLDFTGVRRVLDLLEKKRVAGAALLLISHNEEIFDALVGREHVYYLSVVAG